MKGKLKNTDRGWVVVYSNHDFTGIPTVGNNFPLYPGPFPLPEGVFIDDILIDGKEVEFNIIEESFQDKYEDGSYARSESTIQFAKITKFEAGNSTFNHCLTVGQLKEIIYKLPDDAQVFYQRIEDRYFEQGTGWTENGSQFMPSEFGGGFDHYIRAWGCVQYKNDKNVYITAHY